MPKSTQPSDLTFVKMRDDIARLEDALGRVKATISMVHRRHNALEATAPQNQNHFHAKFSRLFTVSGKTENSQPIQCQEDYMKTEIKTPAFEMHDDDEWIAEPRHHLESRLFEIEAFHDSEHAVLRAMRAAGDVISGLERRLITLEERIRKLEKRLVGPMVATIQPPTEPASQVPPFPLSHTHYAAGETQPAVYPNFRGWD